MDKATLDEFERRCIQEEPAECVASCPLHVDARSLAIEIARGAWPEAWKVLRKTMPLPAVLGRICDHPCELRCKRRECGDAIRIGALERACVRTPEPAARTLPVPRRDKRVAVVGSGLTGLTAASDLARKGYPVTVFDPADRAGGPLLEFAPAELPPEVVDQEVAALKKLGVEFKLGEAVDIPALSGSFAAVFLSAEAKDANRLLKNDALPPECAGCEREKDAGSANSSAIGVTEDVLSRRPVRSGGQDVAFQQPPKPPVAVDPVTLQSAEPGVFAAPVAGRSPIGWAVAGRKAATSVDRFLQGASLAAGREKEGPQPTRLFTSLVGFTFNSAVSPADPAAGYSPGEAREEADRCLRCECLECVKVCEYLRQFGEYPRRHARKIYNDASMMQGDHKSNKLANSCMACDLCTTVCPEDFSMPDLCLGARRELVERGKMPPSAHEFALEDYAWSHSDEFALARSEPGRETSAYLFFPSCQLSGSNPAQVDAVYGFLRESLPGGVGLMLDCCGAPAHWAGRQDLFEQGVADITAGWEELGRPQMIFACPTCLAVLGRRFEGAKVWFLSEILETLGPPQNGSAAGGSAPGSVSGSAAYPARALHDPCTTRHAPLVQASMRRLLATLGQSVEELGLSQEITECCGYGGLQSNANPQLARDVAARRVAESDAEFVTYCAMCRDRLVSVGKRTVHFLDLLFPTNSDPAGRERPGWSERRENRARLKERLLATLWKEEAGMAEPWEGVHLVMDDEMRDRLDKRRILAEDVQRVIQHAEQTGEKLCDPATGRFLAFFRPRSVTFWVEYSPRGEAFEVHNAYAHRMTARTGAS